jgi:hypothetical protein
MANKETNMEETNESKETKKSIWRTIGNWISTFGYFVVAVLELSEGRFISGIGWILAGVGWWSFSKEQNYVETFIRLYRNHLNECEKRDEAYKAKIKEYEGKLSNEKNATKPTEFDVERMNIDDILRIGRDFQKSDTWRGATHDTAKLLCDTIEMLQNKLNKRGNRNCDVYDTLDAAMAACYKDREYCSYASAERKSVISFMLQDVKDNSFNKTNDTKKDGE